MSWSDAFSTISMESDVNACCYYFKLIYEIFYIEDAENPLENKRAVAFRPHLRTLFRDYPTIRICIDPLFLCLIGSLFFMKITLTFPQEEIRCLSLTDLFSATLAT